MTRKDKASKGLFAAAEEGDVTRLRKALADGADVNATTDAYLDHGKTPLFVAANWQHLDCVTALLEAGADVRKRTHCPQTPDRNGGTVLHSLLHSQTPDDTTILKTLLDAGAELDATTEAGETALSLACEYGLANCVKLLIERGSKAHRIAGNQTVVLLDAARFGNTEIIGLLLDQGAPVNIRNTNDMTAIMWACREGGAEAVDLLLQKGADPNLADSRGRTAAHHACHFANRDRSEEVRDAALRIGESLVKGKARFDVRDQDGRLPIEYLDYIGADAPFTLWLGAK